jgi:hypothetical protein
MPVVQEWRKKYAAQGLKVVAVHMPRQEEDLDVEAIKREIAALGIEEPCAIDNNHAIGERFQSQYWPAYFLFDREGLLRGRAAGDAGIRLLESALVRVMESHAAPVA